MCRYKEKQTKMNENLHKFLSFFIFNSYIKLVLKGPGWLNELGSWIT
jgi:hypothetical protein